MTDFSLKKIKLFTLRRHKIKNSSPFDSIILQFCQQLSKILTIDKELRPYPDIVALGYWLRTSHIQQLKNQFEQSREVRLARGLVFHITPGNVDTMFVYSWVISLLTGNKNIVRLSAKGGEVQQRLLIIINNLLNSSDYEQIRQNNLFINYEHNDEITSYLSSIV